VEVLHFLLRKIYQKENCQADWGKAVIVPLYKKGNKMVCSNYRGISLLSIPGKVYTKVEESLAEKQAGFRSGRVQWIRYL